MLPGQHRQTANHNEGVGRPLATLSDTLVILDPPERLIDVDTDHMRQCVWLRDLEKRPNADTILAAATAHGTPRRTCST